MAEIDYVITQPGIQEGDIPRHRRRRKEHWEKVLKEAGYGQDVIDAVASSIDRGEHDYEVENPIIRNPGELPPAAAPRPPAKVAVEPSTADPRRRVRSISALMRRRSRSRTAIGPRRDALGGGMTLA